MVKKLLLSLLFIIGLILLGFWSPWNNWQINIAQIFGVEPKEEFSALKVKSLMGEIEVYLDNDFMGVTNSSEDFLEVFPVEPGEHILTLKKSGVEDYAEVVRKLNFEPAVDVVIGYEIGPNEYFSEGHILYARRSYSSNINPELQIFSTPENVNVYIDERLVGETQMQSISLSVDKRHKLKFEKEGYDPLEIEIFPANQQERDNLKGMILTLEVNLFAQPINTKFTNAE